MADQFFAVKGRKPRYDYTEAINAQTPFLPGRYQLAQNRKQSDKEFAMTEKYLTEQLGLGKKQLKQQKKDARLANILGIGKVGVDAYFASEAAKKTGVPAVASLTGKAADATKSVSGPFAALDKSKALPSAGGITGKAMNWLKPNQGFGELFSLKGLKSGFTPGNLALGGGTGLIAGSLLGKKKKLKSGLIGAGAGAIASYLGSGGDLYKAAIGLGSGGAGGLLSTFL